MIELVQDVLDMLTLYFVYLYPGLISMFIYQFAKGRELSENKTTFIKGVSLSYVYTVILSFICHREVNQFTILDHVIMVVGAVILPIILNGVMRSNWFICLLRKIKIDVEPYDNILDLIKEKETDREKGICIKVFLDNQGIMYEGKLREHESDVNKNQVICLSGYRRYIKEQNKFKVVHDYSADNSQWVYLKIDDVTRMEITYENAK